MGVVCEEKALSPECKAGSEVLKRRGDGQSIENLVTEQKLKNDTKKLYNDAKTSKKFLVLRKPGDRAKSMILELIPSKKLYNDNKTKRRQKLYNDNKTSKKFLKTR